MMTTDQPEVEMDGDPELEQPDVPQLPPDLRHFLLNNFPPGNKHASGFSGGLVDLMVKADSYNLARLFDAFPVIGVAFMMWDEGLIEYAADRTTVNWREQHVDKASILDIQRWSERCRTLQNVLNYSRTINPHTQQQLTQGDISHGTATEFGAY